MMSTIPRRAGRALPLFSVLVFASGCGSSSGDVAAPVTAATPSETVASIAYPVNFQVSLSDSAPPWGRPVTVEGRVKGVGDQRIAHLQFRRRASRWRTIDRGHVGADGRYRFRSLLPGPGTIRVALAPPGPAGGAQDGEQASAAQPVRVLADVSVARRALDPRKGGEATVAGKVLPRATGRNVTAEAYTDGQWRPVADTRTDGGGSYRLAWKPSGNHFVRVVADGDPRAGGTTVLVGQTGKVAGIDAPQSGAATPMTATGPMRSALASRYDDYNLPLACGGTLGVHEQGVAHKTLPCGTMITITFRGRTVQVPVIDRGPYIEPREFDLTGATANTLGFDGVQTIQVSP